MSIKSAVKDHFAQKPILNHWNYFFSSDKVIGSLYCEDGLSIHEFVMEDFGECVHLYKNVFSANPWYDEWTLTQTRTYLNELIKNPTFMGFVLKYDFKIAGVCLGHSRSWWMGKEFMVDEFFVENKMQGNGIGSVLMNFLTDYFSKNDYNRLTLLTNRDLPAEKFYIKNGFFNKFERTVMSKEL